MTLLTTPSKVSPMLNQADGIWNMGEAPDGRDVGGVLGQDPLTAPMPTYEPLLSNGWEPVAADPSLVTYIGGLRPSGGLQFGDETMASFQVVAPVTIDTPQIVVAIFTLATFGGDNPQNPHAYPGYPPYGLLFPTGPHVDVVSRNLLQSPTPAFRVVGVQYVPRTSQRPMASAMQRLRQVRRAVLDLVWQRYGIAESDVAFAVDCASFGGFLAQTALVFYPTEFHAGVDGTFSGAHRSMPSDFDSGVMFSSLLGTDGAPHSYLMRDTVEIPMWCHIEETDFASITTTNRIFAGHLQRPIYFWIGDEDTVTHGTDWIRIVAGNSGLEQPLYGTTTLSSVSGPVEVYWSVVSKSGHGEHRLNAFKLQGVPVPYDTNDPTKPLEVMLEKAHAERTRQGVVPIDDPSVGRKLTGSLPSLDPSRAALAHKGVRTYSPGTMPGLLTENASFQRYGQGTWLGANESLKVKTLPNDTRASIFVGSADGYVTRLKMEAMGTNPVIQPLVEKARSSFPPGGPAYALGHGTWGLDVGEVDDGIPGDEVVVTSYNRVALFTAQDLHLIREVTLPNWEYDNPRKVQIADLLGDPSDGEIVFRTLHGHLVVMDKYLTIRYEHDEGGVIDLVVGPQPARSVATWLKRPIYILSARGHVVRLEIDTAHQQPPPPAPNEWGRLAGASYLEYGGMRDMDLVPWQGQTRLGVLFAPQLGETDAMRFFSSDDCSKVGEFGNLTHYPPAPPPPPAMPPPPMSAQHVNPNGNQESSFAYLAGHGGDHYLISHGGDLSLWDGEMVLGIKSLGTFRPALGHGCVQTGDVDPASPGDEIVVSTFTGRVVWFRRSDLLGPINPDGKRLSGSDFDRSSAGHFFTDANGVVHEHRCNMALAGTWAMSAQPASGSTEGKLSAVDATGTWWEVTPSGVPTRKEDYVGLRSLVDAKATSVPSASNGSGHLWWLTAMMGSTGYLLSTPYLPANSALPAGPWQLANPAAYMELRNGHWPCPWPGARIFDAATQKHWFAWWYRYGAYPNLIQCASYTVSGGMLDPSISLWNSTQGVLPGNAPPPRFPFNAPGYLNPLRTEQDLADPHSMQSLKIGRVLHGQELPQVVAAGMGGRVMLLSGSDGRIIGESADYGLGGMALALADLTGDGLDEVIFAPLYSPISHMGGTVRAHVHVLTGSSGALQELSSTAVGEANNDDFLGYGACGLAVADLPTDPVISKAIFVTTMNGELAVFKQTNGVIDPTALYRKVVAGSLGAFNSIVIENLVPDTASKPEVYIAGSSGIVRLDFP